MRIYFLLLFLFACLPESYSAQDTLSSEPEESYAVEKPQFVEEESMLKKDTLSNSALSNPETLVVKSGEELTKKNRSTLAFLSLLVPGWGEYKMGRHTLGKSLMLADGLMWAGFGAAFFMRALIKDDLRAYLYRYGDCDGTKSASNKTAWDLTDNELELPLYVDSSADYTERIYKPSRDASSVPPIDFYWQWDSEAAHQHYYDLWRNANQARNVAYYFLGAAIITRAASFVTTRYFLKNDGIKSVSTSSLSLNVKPLMLRNNSGLEFAVRF